MAKEKATLELVGAVEDQGRYLFEKWRIASRRPEGFSQFRAFVTSIDDFANFVDLVEGRVLAAKVEKREEILHYLTQLRLQIITEKLTLMTAFLTAMRESKQPMPLGAKPFFKSVRDWVHTVRRINDRSLKELGSTPVAPELVLAADRMLKWGVANSKDLAQLAAGPRRR